MFVNLVAGFKFTQPAIDEAKSKISKSLTMPFHKSKSSNSNHSSSGNGKEMEEYESSDKKASQKYGYNASESTFNQNNEQGKENDQGFSMTKKLSSLFGKKNRRGSLKLDQNSKVIAGVSQNFDEKA